MNIQQIRRQVAGLKRQINDPKTPMDDMITVAKQLAQLSSDLLKALEESRKEQSFKRIREDLADEIGGLTWTSPYHNPPYRCSVSELTTRLP